MHASRSFAVVALAAVLHAAFPAAALAEAPKPSGAAKQSLDLIARGQALFEDQQYEESIQTLSGALVRPNNTTAQKIEIYRLLALNYITLQHRDEAEAAVRGLLALQPAYELPARESPRFRDFFAAVKQRWESEGRPGLASDGAGQPVPVTMKHSSPAQADGNKPVALTANLGDPEGRVAEVKLYYRTGSAGRFEETVASLDAGHVVATIPAGAVKAPLVEYYFQGLDKGGLPVVSRGDASAPLRIPVPDGGGGWVIPVAIGGGVVVAAGILGGLAAGGVFKSNNGHPGGTNPPGTGTVSITVGSSSWGVHW